MSTSTKTGTRLFWMIGLTVVGKPAATVMTSSPGFSRRSPSFGEVRHDRATRLADDPELTSSAWRTPNRAANSRSNWSANRPVVSQKSSDESTRWTQLLGVEDPAGARGPATRPGTNALGGEGGLVVLADQLEDLGPEGLGVGPGRVSHRRGTPCTRRSSAARPSSRSNSGDQPSIRAGLGGAEVLVADLVARLVADVAARGREPISAEDPAGPGPGR